MNSILKSTVIYGLQSTCATFVSLPKGTSSHARGIHYFCLCPGIETLRGAMDSRKDGSKCRKRIVVRPSRFRPGLHELYTYHFPTHYSEACIANRNRIKAAQRLAHDLEHACTPEALTWKIRFFRHYFTVVKGNAAPEPGLKPYARFYHYVYVSILRQLESASRQTQQQALTTDLKPISHTNEVTFEPIMEQNKHFFQKKCRTFLHIQKKCCNFAADYAISISPKEQKTQLSNLYAYEKRFISEPHCCSSSVGIV